MFGVTQCHSLSNHGAQAAEAEAAPAPAAPVAAEKVPAGAGAEEIAPELAGECNKYRIRQLLIQIDLSSTTAHIHALATHCGIISRIVETATILIMLSPPLLAAPRGGDSEPGLLCFDNPSLNLDCQIAEKTAGTERSRQAVSTRGMQHQTEAHHSGSRGIIGWT